MPDLTPLPEGAETLTPLVPGVETLTALAEGTETLLPLVEIGGDGGRTAFFPGLTLYYAPYPYPGAEAYPDNSVGVIVDDDVPVLTPLPDIDLTLTPLTED